jgi:dienelactone hydrolase
MSAGKWHPTILQRLRAASVLVRDKAVMTAFACKRAIQYTSAGQQICGAIYYPDHETRAAAVLMLHTALGLTPHEHAMAARLAQEGYLTLVISYSKRTTGAVIRDDNKRKQLEQITMDGLRFLQAEPQVDADRTAVIGFSLGGYLATHLATTTDESAPKALVIYYGVYDLAETQMAGLRTPFLVLQGENDYPHFVVSAQRVKEISLRDGKTGEVVLYPACGHQFDLFQPNSAATRDAWERTLRFLKQHLKPSEESKTLIAVSDDP